MTARLLPFPAAPALDLETRRKCLAALERKVLWLSSWIIHNANHIRPERDGIKVGGHQASSASMATLMTALYFDVLRPQDRIAVKPHASPVFHAIQYLLGRQTQDKLERFRAYGGAQSYPSRTRDGDDVDFSTGSVGLGVAMTLFAALVQDYVRLKGWTGGEAQNAPDGNRDRNIGAGRMVALVGDAELDEGNVYEALLEGWKHHVRNLWWVIDYNRQSLDAIMRDRLAPRIGNLFESMNWRVVTLKYGKRLERAFAEPGGEALRDWIDNCPNDLYSALTFQGGGAWRTHLKRDLDGNAGIGRLLDAHDDRQLQRVMTNLAGHDLDSLLEAFHAAANDDVPTCFVAYTVKGMGLPFAGHKDNHAGLMNPAQMESLRKEMAIPDGEEWARFAGLDMPAETLEAFLAQVPFNAVPPAARRRDAPAIALPPSLDLSSVPRSTSTQEGFGRLLNEIARTEGELAARIVTTSPDVTVSTNLGPWVNRRGLFDRHDHRDTFQDEKVISAQKWTASPRGQHIELGIAENNLFLMLAALGLSGSVFGERLLPIGTLYDPFIARGLDALNYACYQDARFILVATPSGITLAPEGGAHQSIYTPLIGMGQDKLASYEPAYVDELATILRWSFGHIQAPDGGSVYLRLSTRPLEQRQRTIDAALADAIIRGAYWLVPPAEGVDLAVVSMGALMPEAILAHRRICEDSPGVGLLAVTSADRLHADWIAAMRARGQGKRDPRAHIERLLEPLAPGAGLVTVLDGHPATLSWLGSVSGAAIHPLGVDHFGQSADIPDLYRAHQIDADAVLDAAAEVCLARMARPRTPGA